MRCKLESGDAPYGFDRVKVDVKGCNQATENAVTPNSSAIPDAPRFLTPIRYANSPSRRLHRTALTQEIESATIVPVAGRNGKKLRPVLSPTQQYAPAGSNEPVHEILAHDSASNPPYFTC